MEQVRFVWRGRQSRLHWEVNNPTTAPLYLRLNSWILLRGSEAEPEWGKRRGPWTCLPGLSECVYHVTAPNYLFPSAASRLASLCRHRRNHGNSQRTVCITKSPKARRRCQGLVCLSISSPGSQGSQQQSGVAYWLSLWLLISHYIPIMVLIPLTLNINGDLAGQPLWKSSSPPKPNPWPPSNLSFAHCSKLVKNHVLPASIKHKTTSRQIDIYEEAFRHQRGKATQGWLFISALYPKSGIKNCNHYRILVIWWPIKSQDLKTLLPWADRYTVSSFPVAHRKLLLKSQSETAQLLPFITWNGLRDHW